MFTRNVIIVLSVAISLAIVASIIAIIGFYTNWFSGSAENIFKNSDTIPDPSDSETSTLLADALNIFKLASYVNSDGFNQLDDTYVGEYKRANIELTTDFLAEADAGTRVAVWANVENPTRLIGLYKYQGSYIFRIAYEEDSETYGLRLVHRARSEAVTSSNIVSYGGTWNKTSNVLDIVTIEFQEV